MPAKPVAFACQVDVVFPRASTLGYERFGIEPSERACPSASTTSFQHRSIIPSFHHPIPLSPGTL